MEDGTDEKRFQKVLLSPSMRASGLEFLGKDAFEDFTVTLDEGNENPPVKKVVVNGLMFCVLPFVFGLLGAIAKDDIYDPWRDEQVMASKIRNKGRVGDTNETPAFNLKFGSNAQ